MTLDGLWFTERAPEIGTAFALLIEDKLYEEQTPYQLLEVYQTTHFGRILALDGYIMLSERDNFIYHEMMVHPALFSHPDPRRVAIIGGGDCGSLREVLKHPGVEEAWQVEIDERVTRASERFFPDLCSANDDPRARFEFTDGIAWMEAREPGSLDVIIVDSTDPLGPAAGLFRAPFYRACHRALGENGLLVQQSESPLAHLESILLPMHRAMREGGFGHTDTLLFPLIVYPTGWWSATLAGKGPIRFVRERDAAAGAFPTDYYTPEVHRAAFAKPAFLARALAENRGDGT